jgi:hypothetical protein
MAFELAYPYRPKKNRLPERADDRIHPFLDHPQPIPHFVVIISLTRKAVHLILPPSKSNVLSTLTQVGSESASLSIMVGGKTSDKNLFWKSILAAAAIFIFAVLWKKIIMLKWSPILE